jgi:hypothetical protein
VVLQVAIALNAAAEEAEFACASAFSPNSAALLGPAALCSAQGTTLTITLGEAAAATSRIVPLVMPTQQGMLA